MIYVFFFLASILLSLIFGETKQGTIELVWSTLIGIMFFVRFIRRDKKNPIRVPNTWALLFLITFIPLTISSIYSASPAYSLSFLLRTIAAWCVFVLLFATKKDTRILPLYAKGLLLIGACIALISISLRFFPNLSQSLPALNLIFSQSGHNQGVNLLLTLFPIAFHYGAKQQKAIRYGTYILFSIAIIFCFSRGAVLVAVLYLLFAVITEKSKRNNMSITLLIAVFASATVVLFSTSFFSIPMMDRIQKLPFGLAQIAKSKFSEEARFANWSQAIEGFTTHPLLGTGPNTYILTSMRYHKTPIDGSGFAHNWYLQTLSEVGILGIIPIGAIFFFITRALIKKRTDSTKNPNKTTWATISLIDTVFVALLYSVIEYNLDYFTLWLLLWGTIALLLRGAKTQKTSPLITPLITICCLSVLLVYVGTNIYANTKLNTIETAANRFMLQPYDTNRTERYIEYKESIKQPLTTNEKQSILLWHAKHPDVLITLANAKHILTADERKQLYDQAILFNPLNTYYYQSYLTFLYEEQKGKELQHVYSTFINRAYHVTHPDVEMEVFFRSDDLMIPYLNPELFSVFQGTATFPEVASKSLYFLGLSSLSSAPKMTETAWSLAKDITPDWSSFHMELAAYYLHVEKKAGIAKQVLYDCLKREAPRDACQKEMDTFPNILFPGEQKMNIKMIPEFY